MASGPIPGHPGVISQQRPQTSDEFSNAALGHQWEWNHNPDDEHWSLTARPGYLRLLPNECPLIFYPLAILLPSACRTTHSEFTARADLAAMKNGAQRGPGNVREIGRGAGGSCKRGDDRRLSFFHGQDRVAGPPPHAKHSSASRKSGRGMKRAISSARTMMPGNRFDNSAGQPRSTSAGGKDRGHPSSHTPRSRGRSGDCRFRLGALSTDRR